MAATALPAALLFRSRYRAYLGARVALLVALAVALPAAVHAGMAVAQGPLFASVAAGLTLVAILTTLMGFMGEGTTAASTAWAVFVVVMFGAEIMARSLWLSTGWTSFLGDLQTGVMWMLACTLTSTGLFQLLLPPSPLMLAGVDVMRKRLPVVELHRPSGLNRWSCCFNALQLAGREGDFGPAWRIMAGRDPCPIARVDRFGSS